uniref:tRNA-splicing endonuclease subunit Sen2 n=1 Tax=Fundulus heteroclitus TaxID=8078 RepID=A0A3Q2Q146_FUNHE
AAPERPLLGYFGKGVLSRARPDHSVSDQWEREYVELLRWAEAALSSQGLDEEAISQTLLALSETVEVEEGGGGGVEEANGLKGGEPGGGAGVQMKRLWAEPAAEPEVKRSFNPTWLSAYLSACSPVCLLTCLPAHLSDLQAFFLVYSLGVLSVYLQQEPLSVIELWRKFRSLRPDFVSSYAAYHHFRSRGWVPKGGGGAKYGVDLSKTYRVDVDLSVSVQGVTDPACNQNRAEFCRALGSSGALCLCLGFQCSTGRDLLSTTPGKSHTPAPVSRCSLCFQVRSTGTQTGNYIILFTQNIFPVRRLIVMYRCCSVRN